ncbi:hypothetical protein BC827DRAFT_806669 [Russula dissimulans]|nr:hypothetical protein BC827DRAFT_806669 [Russula dissimulans]
MRHTCRLVVVVVVGAQLRSRYEYSHSPLVHLLLALSPRGGKIKTRQRRPDHATATATAATRERETRSSQVQGRGTKRGDTPIAQAAPWKNKPVGRGRRVLRGRMPTVSKLCSPTLCYYHPVIFCHPGQCSGTTCLRFASSQLEKLQQGWEARQSCMHHAVDLCSINQSINRPRFPYNHTVLYCTTR